MQKLLLTVEEFCSCIGIGRTLGFRLLREREFESFLIGRKRLVTMSSVQRYISRRQAEECRSNYGAEQELLFHQFVGDPADSDSW